jgi:UDP-N-acetylglucosamine 2-epimerase (non-hydrolysing)
MAIKKILLIFGTRPEALKMAPVFLALKKHFNTKICVTAQHREMLDQALDTFQLTADIDLDLMQKNQTLSSFTARSLEALTEQYIKEKPDLILVHGDTTTALTAALAAFYLGIKIGHVEAGLRTFNLEAPFPEEFNRQVISKIANMHFAPTELNRENLINEGVVPKDIFVTGNTVIDSISLTIKKINEDKAHEKLIHDKLCINGFDPIADQIILITGHRRENFGDGFLNICEAIKSLAKKYPSYSFIYPVHLNPIVSKPVQKLLSGLDNIFLINPLDYDQFIYLLSNTYLVLTDSGGIQEEAPGIGKPVLVMRDVTERPEGVNSGTVKLVGTQPSSIIEEVSKLLNSKAEYEKMSKAINPYGDGNAAKRILSAIKTLKT